MSVNKVILVGNVGKDPETRYLDENTALCRFPMATSETYKNRSGERVSNTEWHNVVLWRGLAQVAEKYVKKGTQIYIEGRIKTRSYDDAEGNKKYVTEIVGDQMQLLGRKPDDGAAQGDSYGYGNQTSAQPQAEKPAQGSAPQGGSPQAGTTNGGASGAGGTAPGTGGETPGTGGETPGTGGATPGAGGQQGGAAPQSDPDPFDGGDSGPDDLPF